ncbi:MAG: hypothetical protein AAF226_13575, partial [Verrucomicrobiota bacterium]
LGELNPQILDQLAEVEQSEPLIDAINFLHTEKASPTLRKEFVNGLLSMHETHAGASLLKITRVHHFEQFQESHLDGVKDLIKRYQELTDSPANYFFQ